MDVRGGFGLGGGGAKKRAVSDLAEEFRKLNTVLERTEQLSKNILENLTKTKGGGSAIAPNVARPPAAGFSSGFINQGQPSDLGYADNAPAASGMSFSSFLMGTARALKPLVGAGAAAAVQAIDTGQYIENDIARSRFGFMGGQRIAGYGGGTAGSSAFRAMMAQGTATDPMDAARAAMQGMSMGMMPGLANYSTIAASAATFSNLVPGAGLQGGMGAVAGLNQAGNVNRLRMIGINVRDANTGLMRSINDIANDLWNHLNRQKTGGRAISKEDISLSLQPGNSLDSMLNQYFGNDPVLRQGVISVLYQKASGRGLSKEELNATNALPDIAKSIGGRQAASYGALDAYTSAGISGIIEANTILANASKKFEAHVDSFGGIIQDIVKQVSKLETLGGGGNGAGQSLIGGITAFLGGMLGAGGPIRGLFGGLFGGGGTPGGTVPGGGAPKTGGSLFARGGGLFSRLFDGAAAYTGMEWLQGQLNKINTPELLNKNANFLFDLLQGAVTGGLTAGPYGAVAGMAATGAGAIANPYGDQGGDDWSSSGTMPVSGPLRVTSQFGAVRHLTVGGKKSPSYGRPHSGIDLDGETGDPIFAAKDGTVVETAWSQSLGNYVKIRHDDGYHSLYGHLSQKLATGGLRVKAGDLIGKMGSTGFSTGSHLHFQVQRGDTKVDPMAWLGGNASSPEGLSNSSASGVYSGLSGASSSLFGTPNITPLFNEATRGALFSNSSDIGGEMGGSTTTINYGGVNVSIQVPGGTAINEEKLAREVKRILDDQTQFDKAVSR